jgi:hypothetical protein
VADGTVTDGRGGRGHGMGIGGGGYQYCGWGARQKGAGISKGIL